MPKSSITKISVSSGTNNMLVTISEGNAEIARSFLVLMTELLNNKEQNQRQSQRQRKSQRQKRKRKLNHRESNSRRKRPRTSNTPQWKLGQKMVRGMSLSNPSTLTAMTYEDLLRYHGNEKDANRVWRKSSRF